MSVVCGHGGAPRLAYNHHLARVKANLDQRAAERSYGVAEADLTPSLSWSKVAFINHINGWKDGRAPDARVSYDEDGNEAGGLSWRGEVSTDVFECASVNAAQALANWSKSRAGERAGSQRGSRGSSRGTRPGQRSGFGRSTRRALRRRCARPGRGRLRFPKLGELRVRENTRQFRNLYETGRFHARGVVQVRARPVGVSVTGVAAQLHYKCRGPQALVRRRDPSRRPRGAAAQGLLHQITGELARGYTSVTIEDLNVDGMLQNRKLARVVSDAAFGEFRRGGS